MWMVVCPSRLALWSAGWIPPWRCVNHCSNKQTSHHIKENPCVLAQQYHSIKNGSDLLWIRGTGSVLMCLAKRMWTSIVLKCYTDQSHPVTISFHPHPCRLLAPHLTNYPSAVRRCCVRWHAETHSGCLAAAIHTDETINMWHPQSCCDGRWKLGSWPVTGSLIYVFKEAPDNVLHILLISSCCLQWSHLSTVQERCKLRSLWSSAGNGRVNCANSTEDDLSSFDKTASSSLFFWSPVDLELMRAVVCADCFDTSWHVSLCLLRWALLTPIPRHH